MQIQDQTNYKYIKLEEIRKEGKYCFIDFDYTIANFGTAKFELLRMLEVFGLTKELWDRLYLKHKNGIHVFMEKDFVKELSETINLEEVKLREIFDSVWDNYSKYIYHDVEDFLSRNKDENLFVFSLGAEDFQMQKLVSTGLSKYFKGAYYTKIPKGQAIVQIAKDLDISELTLIDDRKLNLDEIKKTMSTGEVTINYYLLQRPKGQYSSYIEEVDTEYNVIKSLSEI